MSNRGRHTKDGSGYLTMADLKKAGRFAFWLLAGYLFICAAIVIAAIVAPHIFHL